MRSFASRFQLRYAWATFNIINWSLYPQGLNNLLGSRGNRSGSASKKAKTEDKKKTSSSLPTPNLPIPVSTADSTPVTPGASTPAGGAQLSDLQNILGRLGGAASPSPAAPIDIAEAMRAEDLIPMLADEKIRDALAAHLPGLGLATSTEPVDRHFACLIDR